MESKSIIRFFESENAPFILSTIYVEAYKDLGCAAIKKNNIVYIIFENLNLEKTNQEGFELISHNFENYYEKFSNYLINIDDIMNNLIAKKQYKTFIDKFIEFLSFYRYTEFFYTDLCYKNKNNLELDLKKLEQIKTNGRKFLNRFFNGEDSYLSKMAQKDANILWSKYEELQDKTLKTIKNANERQYDYVYKCNDFSYKTTDVDKYNTLFQNIYNPLIKGICASKGNVIAPAYVLVANFNNFDNLEQIIEKIPNNVILISETTSPDIVAACAKAVGIITNQGGLGSHAAIISRELKIPCVVGTKNATKIIKTGDLISLDANKGEIKIINSNQYIYDFDEVSKELESTVGGKAYSLAKLYQNNMNIAQGIVISKNFWNNYSKNPSDELIEQLIKEIILKLDVDRFAVRSSAIGEDSDKFSWAGCFNTYLNVSKEELKESIINCGQSLLNNRAINYQKLNHDLKPIDEISFIIQEYIKGDCNGVCFSQNPVTQDNEIVIEVINNYQLVDGIGDPETLYINKDCINMPNSKFINRIVLENLVTIVKKIEVLWEVPVDIEFTIKNDIIFIMQTRPITTL